MTQQEFLDAVTKSIGGDAVSFAENLISQRDDALLRIDGKDAETANLNTQLIAANNLVATLGGTELGLKLAKDKQVADLTKQKLDVEAKLAELSK